MRVLIVDDHPIIVSGCAAMLAGEGDIDVVDARDAETGLAVFAAQKPDVTVVDIGLPGVSGFELTRRILEADPQARIVVFSMNDDPIFAARAIQMGAKGYVTKNDDPYLLLTAVREVASGGVFLMPKIANRLAFEKSGAATSPLSALTARELEILRMLGRGLGMAEIADATQVSYKTIANSCSIMKRKLGARTPMELMRIALEHKLT
ncbi:response regulator transcription factor [Methylocystis sp. L43]|jgi:two-component system invasion response regulator UvrY|uniref:response regulator transcription factor n=1 Tax=unclassified Methylocystis TaxID=2625913 RepID=UPI0018C25EC8|nr:MULTISPECIES: response regulator transcription factor [unclassified Methylocystis]MBG0798481.1 response regulator transcription factor [Methylocystis sp. L43]MBG0805955.1 response regulator transcription factor [Methylocystis sp. H15]